MVGAHFFCRVINFIDSLKCFVGREEESLYEARRVLTSTEKGVEEHGLFNGGSMEDAQFYSILLCFYKAGKARIGNFFLAKSFKVS